MNKKVISDIMSKDVIILKPEYTLTEATAILSNHKISCLIVCDGKKPLGILTERDIVKFVANNPFNPMALVKEIMSSPVITVSENTDLYLAIRLMRDKRIRRLVITDQEGNCSGLLTLTDMVNSMESGFFVIFKDVASAMTTNVITLPKEALLKEAISIMGKRGISCVVVTEEEKVVGILTERDVVTVLAQDEQGQDLAVHNFISSPVITVQTDENLYNAARLMKKHNFRRLVILNPEGKLRGIITQTDILHHIHTGYVQALEETVEKDRRLFNSLKEGVCEIRCTEDGKISWINTAGAEILGFASPYTLIGREFRSCFVKKEAWQSFLMNMVTHKILRNYTFQIIRKDGQICCLEGTYSLSSDVDTAEPSIEGTFRDITERLTMEEALKLANWGMHLTPVPTTYSMCGYGRLSKDNYRV